MHPFNESAAEAASTKVIRSLELELEESQQRVRELESEFNESELEAASTRVIRSLELELEESQQRVIELESELERCLKVETDRAAQEAAQAQAEAEERKARSAATLERWEREVMNAPKQGTEIQRKNIEAWSDLKYLDNPVFYEAIKEGLIKGYKDARMHTPKYMNEEIVLAILYAGNHNEDESKHLSKYMEGVPEEEKPQKLKEFFRSLQLAPPLPEYYGGGLAFQKMRKRSRKTKSKRRKSKSKRRKSKTRRRRR